MSTSEPPEDPNAWNPDDTGAVPVGPEPEPTGAGGAGGAGGWGQARVEPFAVAALVWAIVSIVIPLIGTIVAFVLAARAADLIRRSRGERTGMQYVTAARIVAGAVLALWIIGGIAFLALRDDGSSGHVAVPTQPTATTVAPVTTSTTLAPSTTTTTKPPVTTSTLPPPTISVIPPTVPPTVPPTSPPTSPPTTIAPTNPPTTAPPTTAAPTTKPPPSTTTPEQAAAKVQAKVLTKIGDSNRGLPNDERVAVNYTPGQDLFVTWGINNGAVGEHPTGTPTCSSPPTNPPTSTSSPSSTTTSTTSTAPTPTSSTSPPAGKTTQEQARYEARQMLQTIKAQITTLHLDVLGIQLVGTYPIEGAAEEDVVQVLYGKSVAIPANYLKMFDVPPAEVVQCLNPAFDLP
jgi:hypothetical protein